MDEKLKKALRTSKQGVWALLILLVGVGVISMLVTTTSLESYFPVIISGLALITGLVLYRKEKYAIGAEVIQWVGLGQIILNISDIVITYVFIGVFTLQSLVGIIPLLKLLIAIVLIWDALKVIRLVDNGENRKSKVTLIAILIIAIVIVVNTLKAVEVKKGLDAVHDYFENQIQNGVVDNNENKEDNNNEEQNKPAEDNEEEVKDDEKEDETDKESEKMDPYANYKNIKWATTSVTDSKSGATLSIEKSTVYLTYGGKKTKVIGITGTPSKVLFVLNMQVAEFYILTKEGDIYVITGYETSARLHLKNKEYVDMTYINNYTNEYIYYLTADGKLIDENGVSYDKYKFVSILRGTGLNMPITFDKDYNGYYYNSKNNTYTAIVSKSTGAKLAFSKVYEVEDGEKLLVQTANNKLFEYDGKNNKAVAVGVTVKSVNKLADSEKFLIIFTDGTTKVYDGFVNAWDIKKDEVIQSLKVFDPYANYKNIKWATTSVTDSKSGTTLSIEKSTVYLTYGGKKTKVTGTTGTAKKMYCAKNTGGAFSCYVLVDEGVIYNIYDFEKTATKVVNLSKYNIIDITEINNYTKETIYYLTADGKLIDKNGVSYDKYGFVTQYTMGRPSGGWSIDKNGYVYSYNESLKKYEPIVNKANSAKLIISKIYTVLSENENEPGYNNIILTTDNKIFVCNEYSNKATQITGDVSKVISIVNEEDLNLVTVFTDGKIKTFKGLSSGYDVKTKKDIDINSSLEKLNLDVIGGITVRKNGYNTAFMLSREQIIEFRIYLEMAQRIKEEIEDLSKYEYWIGITTGDTKSLVRTYDNNLIDYNNAIFYSEYLVDYIKSITKDVQWN